MGYPDFDCCGCFCVIDRRHNLFDLSTLFLFQMLDENFQAWIDREDLEAKFLQ